jgi:putative transposase
LDETGILRSFDQNSCPFATGRVSSLKPFYRATTITAIGAISINKVLAVMTMNDLRDGVAFAVFIEKLLCPQLWARAVVVMDYLPAHKLASIVPIIEALGASFIC